MKFIKYMICVGLAVVQLHAINGPTLSNTPALTLQHSQEFKNKCADEFKNQLGTVKAVAIVQTIGELGTTHNYIPHELTKDGVNNKCAHPGTIFNDSDMQRHFYYRAKENARVHGTYLHDEDIALFHKHINELTVEELIEIMERVLVFPSNSKYAKYSTPGILRMNAGEKTQIGQYTKLGMEKLRHDVLASRNTKASKNNFGDK